MARIAGHLFSVAPAFPDPIDTAHYGAVLARIDELAGCTEGSPQEEEELARLTSEAEDIEERLGWMPGGQHWRYSGRRRSAGGGGTSNDPR